MSYLRERVEPVTCRPPPGSYAGPTLRVWLQSATPNCKIFFTLDGSEPIENSDRDHGFRCEHYLPLKGHVLRGGGKHTLTVMACREGLVPTRPTTFTFHLDGPPLPVHKLKGQDNNIQHAFDLICNSSHSKSRAQSPALCVLRDVCPREILKRRIDDGTDIRVYRLQYKPGAVSRSLMFERVATPSVKMTMPVLPSMQSTAAKLSLQNTAERCMTPAVYERPALLEGIASTSRALQGSRGVATSLTERPQSPPAALHMQFFNSSIDVRDDTSGSVLPKLRVDPHRERCVNMKVVSTDLSLFELRNGVAVIRPDGVQEAADKLEEDAYVAACEKQINEEVRRKGQVSQLFPRLAAERFQQASHEDVAEASKEALTTFMVVEELVKSETVRAIATAVPYAELHKKWNGFVQMTSAEVSSSVGGVVSVDDVRRSLKPLGVRSSEGVTKYSAKMLLCVVRYLVTLAAPIPEAPIFTFLQLWRTMVDVATEGPVSKLSFLTAIDVYRRTRGANSTAVAQLQDMYYNGLEWGRDGTTTVMKWAQSLQELCPHVDAAIERMGDLEAPMYRTPLVLT